MAEETVLEVTLGPDAPLSPHFSLHFSCKLGGTSSDPPSTHPVFPSPLPPFQPCLVLETPGPTEAESLSQVLSTLFQSEAPGETAVTSLIHMVKSLGSVSIQPSDNHVLLTFTLNEIKKEQLRGYLAALGAQTKPIQSGETTVTGTVSTEAGLEEIFRSDNLSRTVTKAGYVRLQAGLSSELAQGLTQLSLNMSASDSIQQAFLYFSFFRKGHISLHFHSYDELPPAAQALFPPSFPTIPQFQSLKESLGDTDRHVIESLSRLLTGTGHAAFNGKFFSVSGSLVLHGLSRLFHPI